MKYVTFSCLLLGFASCERTHNIDEISLSDIIRSGYSREGSRQIDCDSLQMLYGETAKVICIEPAIDSAEVLVVYKDSEIVYFKDGTETHYYKK